MKMNKKEKSEGLGISQLLALDVRGLNGMHMK
jgi:hypothetical protein